MNSLLFQKQLTSTKYLKNTKNIVGFVLTQKNPVPAKQLFSNKILFLLNFTAGLFRKA